MLVRFIPVILNAYSLKYYYRLYTYIQGIQNFRNSLITVSMFLHIAIADNTLLHIIGKIFNHLFNLLYHILSFISPNWFNDRFQTF